MPDFEINQWNYLGDGLYFMFDGWNVILMAGTPEHQDHVVYLEPRVLAEFERTLARLKESKKKGGDSNEDRDED